MYHFVVSFKAYPEAKISLIAQFSLGILQIWYWELILEGPDVPDHAHMNGLNQADVYA